jgi:hypothetical protein
MLYLNRSGTEEEYTELHQLLEDITTHRRDMKELKEKQAVEKEHKKRKEIEDKLAGQKMRKEAMEGPVSRHAFCKPEIILLCCQSCSNHCKLKTIILA